MIVWLLATISVGLAALLIHVINLYRRELEAHERTQAHLAEIVDSYTKECDRLRKLNRAD